jgi:beta-lactamase regulating signal transducer with metallopeptidase domain
MHLVTQSALLKALGWSLFNSLWQMALLWLCYMLLTAVFRKASADLRHGLAVSLLGVGAIAFALSFFTSYSLEDGGQPFNGWYSARAFISPFLPYCSSLYILALVYLFTRYSHHYLYSRRLKSTGLSKIRPALRVFVEQTSRRMGIKKEVRVWLSSLVEGPVTLGFLKPVILIPFATVNNLSMEQVEAILLHELAHIKRFDYLLNLGVTMLGILFFFNPFTRLLIRDIRREREHRCDDLVMQFRYDPHIYVSALLSLASPDQHRHQLALAATGIGDRLLLHRVKRILKQSGSDERPGTRSVVLLLFTMLTAFIGLSGGSSPVFRLVQRSDRTAKPGAIAARIDATVANSRSPMGYEGSTAWPDMIPPSAKKTRLANPVSNDKPDKAGDQPDDQPGPDIYLASSAENNQADPVDSSSHEDAGYTIVQPVAGTPDPREYSIQASPEVTNIPLPETVTNSEMPFVPASSFSYRIMEDSSASMKQLSALVQGEGMAGEFKVRLNKAMANNESIIKKLQCQVNCQVHLLEGLRSEDQNQQAAPGVKTRTLEKQIKLRRVQIIRQEDLQRKLMNVATKLTIVYI